MRSAMPLLRLASDVTVLTVAEKDSPFPARSAAAFLSRHGIHVDVEERDGGGASVEQVIRSVAVKRCAGLIIQGAYRHSRLREMLLGGVTRGLLTDAPMPILLDH